MIAELQIMNDVFILFGYFSETGWHYQNKLFPTYNIDHVKAVVADCSSR